jgi:hypothetical protein
VSLYAQAPGDCHIALTFANGLIYSGDVQFTYSGPPQLCCGCDPALTLAASPGVLAVNNPAATCVPGDAGP